VPPRVLAQPPLLVEREPARLARRELAERDRAHADAQQPHHGMAERLERAADLPLAPLDQGEREGRAVVARLVVRAAHLGGCGERPVVEADPALELAERCLRHPPLRRNAVDPRALA